MMSRIESITVLSTLVFGISLLYIIRTVRKGHYEFVNSAVGGWPWLGLGWIRIRFYIYLHRLYFKDRGCDFWLILNLISFIAMLFLGLLIFCF
jgi:hypothetical protein